MFHVVASRTLRRAILATSVALIPASLRAADSDTPVGIHWWGLKDGAGSFYDGINQDPANLLDSVNRGGWDTEIINTHGDPWQQAAFFQPLYNDLYANKHISLITRVEYAYGTTVPSPATINTATWAGNVTGIVNTLQDSAHLWQLGNEPNITGEGSGWTNNQITPAGYADIYKQVRGSIQSTGQAGAPGAHKLLVAPVSPGGAAGARWIDGNQWLGQTIDALQSTGTPIDGFALHSYGGGATTAD